MFRLIGYQLATQGFNALLGIAYWAGAARLLTLGDVGRAAATLALISFVANTSNLGLGVALIRHRNTREWDYPRLAGGAVLGASLVALMLSALIVMFAPTSGDEGLVLASWALIPLALIALICNMLDSLSLADNDGAGFLIRNATATFGKLLLLVLLVRDGSALVITTMGAVFLSGLVVWPRRQRSVKLSIALPHLPPRFASYALKQYVVTWLSNLPNYLFPVLALAVLGPDVAGYVALAWGGALLLASAGDTAGIALLREGSRDAGSLGGHHRRALLGVGAALTAAVAVALVGAPLLTFVFGRRFDENAVALFRLFALASLPYFVFSTTVGRMRALDRSFGAAVLAAVSGLGGCALLVVLAPLAGSLAPGWAYLLANVGASLVALWFLRSIGTPDEGSTSLLPADGIDPREPHPDLSD